MKKIGILLLAACMAISLAACKNVIPDSSLLGSFVQEELSPTQEVEVQWVQVDNPVMTTAASSTYSGDRATHDAVNLLDGDTKTNWTEGVPGDGIGEYVEFGFYDSYLLNAIYIFPGNQYDKSRYLDNSRPEHVTVTFSDGSTMQFTLKDMMEGQAMVLSEPVVTDSVRITIDSVFHGSEYTDTVISDVAFDAYMPVFE